MSRPGPLGRAVAAALRATPPEKQDAGAVALAKTYARLLDDAGFLHGAAVEALEDCDPGDPVGRAAAQRLADALSARQAVADLGPKLLAALAALYLTPQARGTKRQGDKPHDPVRAKLDELAQRRNDRRRRGSG